jgi:hypothetical protein
MDAAGETHGLVAMALSPAEARSSFPGTTAAPMIPIDAAAKLVPELLSALEGGQVMRVVGGPAGELMKSGRDTLAIARNADGTIAGPLHFDGGPRNVRTVAAPAAVFQLAGALTLQHYLNTISKQLEALQEGVQDIKGMLVQAQEGELYAAQRFVAQQEELVADGVRLGSDLTSAIEGQLQSVRAVYSAVRDRLQHVARLAAAIIDDAGQIVDHDAFDEELEHMLTERRRDAVTMLIAVDLTVRLLRLQQVVAAERALGQAPVLRRTALAELAELREDVALLGPLFSRWLVSNEAVAAHEAGFRVHHRFSTTGRLLKLRDYELATQDLRRLLDHAPGELIPAGTFGEDSFMIDCERAGDGAIVARMSALELPS